MKLLYKYISLILLSSVFLVASCDEDTVFSSNPSLHLTFSCDTISFDTLFTTVGSPTATMRVYNRNKESLRISNVQLLGGGQNGFRMNVDGQYSSSIQDLEIRKNDSLYVYVEVTPAANGADTPLILTDSICFTLESGVQQYITLLAYGRDAEFMHGPVFATDTLLECGHYVVYDSLVVAPNATLTLEKGVTLYFHSRAGMRVKGTLNAVGTVEEPIVFRGDRTDNLFSYLPYDRVPGQWQGITIDSTSNNNTLVHCDIHSAKFGIKVEPGDTLEQRLHIESSRIENFDGNALETINSRVNVVNSLLANARGNCVKVVGGRVNFSHCTIANFYVWKLRDVALALHNSLEGVPMPLRKAVFANCIIAGSGEDEVMGYLSEFEDSIPDASNYLFVNSLINTVPNEENENFVNVVYDNSELHPFAKEHFRLIDHNIFLYDFHLTDSTTARGIAASEYAALTKFDIDGVERPAEGADVGCFQFVEPVEEPTLEPSEQ